eukprot:CAMPEP_0117446148 /NCGR_PEP_ID=MMETSP0759-20121206/6175_1 /TAXON_ID=63605 /ORGANISM="Percolomonas cosmopolitus, Strain WS" /LENGTH=848 /DNA_ID=CAMNT_0005238373 /DNA_START=36 /DNA_END=2582 /DNA_ORIENTATION=-
MTSVEDHASNFFLKRPPPKVTKGTLSNHESIRLVQSDVAAYKSKLELIFRTARAFVSPVLTLDRWRILLVEHYKLVDKYLTDTDVEYIYEMKDTEWNFNCFVSALWDAAVRKYVDRSVSGALKIVKKKGSQNISSSSTTGTNNTSSSSLPADINMRGGAKKQNAFKKLLSLMFDSSFNIVYFNEIPLTRWNETPSIESIFHMHEKVLKRLFLSYSKRINSALDHPSQLHHSTDNILPYVTYQKFVKFCTDYRFYPERIDALALQRIFASFDDRKDSTTYSLNFSHFCDAFIRFAIMLYAKDTSASKRDAPPHEKISSLFSEIGAIYEDMFDRALQDDLVDLSRIGPPTVTKVDPTSVPSSGNILTTFHGINFDQRLGGVILRIRRPAHRHDDDSGSSSKQTDVPCRFVSPTEVQCRMPPIINTPLEMSTHVDMHKDPSLRDTFVVNVSNRAPFHVQASNNGQEFSLIDEDCPVVFEYVDCMEPFVIDPSVIQPLHRIFTQYCQLEEPKNLRLLSVYKWKLMKHEMSKIRNLQLPHFPDILHSMDRELLVKKMRVVSVSDSEGIPQWTAEANQQQNETKQEEFEEMDDESSPEFYLFAQARPLKKLLVFLEFVRMLIYFTLFTVEDLHPLDFLLELAARWEQVVPKSKTIHSVMRVEQVTELKKELALIRTQKPKTFDIYNGCVLVGNILDQPGYVQCMGETVLTAVAHKLWTYKQYDEHTQSAVMRIMEFSSSFDHFVHRLLSEGFDIAAPTSDIRTRSPLGRSWTIYNIFTQEKVGALWDYPGTIARMSWVPRARQIDNAFTLTVYDDTEFLPLFVMFRKCDTIQRFRELLQRAGNYKIRTKLYEFG